MQHNLIDSRSGNINVHILETIEEIRLWAAYGLYYRIVNFIRNYNDIVAIKGDVSILRRCRLKYLGVMCWSMASATYFQMVQQNVIHINIEKKQM